MEAAVQGSFRNAGADEGSPWLIPGPIACLAIVFGVLKPRSARPERSG